MKERFLFRSATVAAFVGLGVAIFAPQANANQAPSEPQLVPSDLSPAEAAVVEIFQQFPGIARSFSNLSCTSNSMSMQLDGNRHLIIGGPDARYRVSAAVGIGDSRSFPEKPISLQTMGSDGKWKIQVGSLNRQAQILRDMAKALLERFGLNHQPTEPTTGSRLPGPCAVPSRA